MSGLAGPAPYECRACRRTMAADTLTLTAAVVQPPDYHGIGVLRSGAYAARFIERPPRLEARFADGEVYTYQPTRELDGVPFTDAELGAYLSYWVAGSTLCTGCREHHGREAARAVRSAAAEAEARRRRAEEAAAAAAAVEAEARARAEAAAEAARQEERQRVRSVHDARAAPWGGPAAQAEAVARRGALWNEREAAIGAARMLRFRADTVNRTLIDRVITPQLCYLLAVVHVAGAAVALVARGPVLALAVLTVASAGALLAYALTRTAVEQRLVDQYFGYLAGRPAAPERPRHAAIATGVVALAVGAVRHAPVPTLGAELLAIAAVAGGAALAWWTARREMESRVRDEDRRAERAGADLTAHRDVLERFRCGQSDCDGCSTLGW